MRRSRRSVLWSKLWLFSITYTLPCPLLANTKHPTNHHTSSIPSFTTQLFLCTATAHEQAPPWTWRPMTIWHAHCTPWPSNCPTIQWVVINRLLMLLLDQPQNCNNKLIITTNQPSRWLSIQLFSYWSFAQIFSNLTNLQATCLVTTAIHQLSGLGHEASATANDNDSSTPPLQQIPGQIK